MVKDVRAPIEVNDRDRGMRVFGVSKVRKLPKAAVLAVCGCLTIELLNG
jgi:hypothetical protein